MGKPITVRKLPTRKRRAELKKDYLQKQIKQTPTPQNKMLAERLYGKEFNLIPTQLIAKLHAEMPRGYIDDRSLNKGFNNQGYDAELKNYHLPLIKELVTRTKKRKVRFLDVGAGQGNLGPDLMKKYPNSPQSPQIVEYHAIDVKATPILDLKGIVVGKVEKQDIVSDRLPRNIYDIIVAVQVFQYVTDKFRALENLINALRVNGTLAIANFGKVKDLTSHTDNPFDPRDLLYRIVIKPHPWLKVEITSNNGILITKNEDRPVRFNAELVEARWRYFGQVGANNPISVYRIK